MQNQIFIHIISNLLQRKLCFYVKKDKKIGINIEASKTITKLAHMRTICKTIFAIMNFRDGL